MDYTIIIPHKNVPDMLSVCIDTIPEMEGLEIIVVDDNSSEEVVDFDHFPGAEREDVSIILTKEGKGAGYARNVGMSKAKGRWLVFVDADDAVTRDFRQLILRYRESDADMVVFKADSIELESGERSDRHKQHNEAVDEYLEGKESALQAAVAVAAPWCRMIKRELVERNGLRFDELPVANDVMFISEAACLADQITIDPSVLYVITARQGSLVHSHEQDGERYLIRMDVSARANDLWRRYGLRRLPIIRMVWQARRNGLFFKALNHAVRKGILFSGVSNYWYLVRRRLR